MTDTDHADHLTFLKHLDASHDAVWCAARWLQNKGHHVVVTPTTKSKTHGEWKQHADSGDLYLQQRIEVKKRGIDFTGAGDWPHGDKFIVCSRHSYDLARPKPYAWIILNKAKTHAAIVKAESRTRWVVEKRTDSRYQNYTQEFYFCPLDCVTWVKPRRPMNTLRKGEQGPRLLIWEGRCASRCACQCAVAALGSAVTTFFRHLANARGKTVLRVISAADRPLAGNLIMARKKLAV
jgi:hypothetical protein